MFRSPVALILSGALLLLLGIAGLAIPQFSAPETKDIAAIGDLKIQTRVESDHHIPFYVAGGAVVVGILLLGKGLMSRSPL